MNTLVIYSTVDGQAKAICEQISLLNRQLGATVTMVSLADAEALSLADFDKVLIGASIRYGKHRPELYQFINRHHAILSAKQNAFFSVNVVARKPEKTRQKPTLI